jgi:hypothetical protein
VNALFYPFLPADLKQPQFLYQFTLFLIQKAVTLLGNGFLYIREVKLTSAPQREPPQ